MHTNTTTHSHSRTYTYTHTHALWCVSLNSVGNVSRLQAHYHLPFGGVNYKLIHASSYLIIKNCESPYKVKHTISTHTLCTSLHNNQPPNKQPPHIQFKRNYHRIDIWRVFSLCLVFVYFAACYMNDAAHLNHHHHHHHSSYIRLTVFCTTLCSLPLYLVEMVGYFIFV